jgi:hypothetical protein
LLATLVAEQLQGWTAPKYNKDVTKAEAIRLGGN